MAINHSADEDRNMAAEAAGGKNGQPSRDPRLDAVAAEDGFDEEYTFEYKGPAATTVTPEPVTPGADAAQADGDLPIARNERTTHRTSRSVPSNAEARSESATISQDSAELIQLARRLMLAVKAPGRR